MRFRGSWQERDWEFDPDQLLGPPGGFGSVHPGSDDQGTDVAVKRIGLMGPTGLPISERLRNRELDIAEKLRTRDGQHLMRILDVGLRGEDLLIVMSRAERSLATEVAAGRPWPELVPILRDMTEGLRELHEAGVLHRDIKPGNVLLHEGSWKLSDFGLAHDQDLGTQTETFKGAGTLPYMAPELFDLQSATVKSDLYAPGCTAFELLTGSPPYSGSDINEYRDSHRNAPIPDVPNDVSPILRSVVMRLLAKDPMRRPQDARAVLDEVSRIATAPTALQARLQEGYAAQEAASAAREAKQREQVAQIESQRADASQAGADLVAIVTEAEEQLRESLPNVSLVNRGPGLGDQFGPWGSTGNPSAFMLVGLNAEIEIRIWRTLPVGFEPGDPAIVGGEVWGRNSSHPEGEYQLMANIVAERDEEGRIAWHLYRFMAQGGVVDYPWTTEREHGIEAVDFGKHRKAMRGSATHIWTARIVPLKAESILEAFAEALELDQSWH